MVSMLQPLLTGALSRSASKKRTAPRLRVMVEGLEPRDFFSVTPLSIPVGVVSSTLASHHALNHVNAKDVTSILPLTITSVALANGQLVANGSLGGQAFAVPLALSVSPVTPAVAGAATAVPILDLSLAPIHLNLLGLAVDTSKICLDIAAQPGSGNLLGNLLAGVANLLNSGTPLGSIFANLGTDLNSLLGGITGLLNGALGQLTAPTSLSGVTSSAAGAGGTGALNVLNLSLGPVNLNLLGLTVSLDNCAGGPVTLDITAQPGPGNLLGNLIGDVSNLLNSSASQQGILSSLNQITQEITSLL